MISLKPAEHNEGSGECRSLSGGETSTTSSGQGGGVSRIITACREFFDSFSPPIGYEDETGFHYGSEVNSDEA
jgi:hypothetical protein